MSVRQSSSYGQNMVSFQTGARVDSSYTPTRKERTEELKKQGQKAVCGLEDKKSFARQCIDLKSQFLKDAEAVAGGETNLTDEVKKLFDSWKNKNTIKNMSNKNHATNMAQLFEFVTLIADHLKKVEGESTGVKTRREKQQQNLNRPPEQILYDKIIALRDKVDSKIRESLNAPGGKKNQLLCGLTIESAMVGRPFHPDRVPRDPGHWKCVYCGCYSTNTLPEDDGLEERNAELIKMNKLISKRWTDFKEALDAAVNANARHPPNPPHPKTGLPMTSAPRELKASSLESPRLICPCLNSKNINPGLSDELNGCIAKCRKRRDPNDTRHAMELAKDDTLERYEWVNGEPTCPHCRCLCNKVYRIKDIPAISLARKQDDLRILMGQGPPPDVMMRQFLAQSIIAGRQAADDIEFSQRQNESPTDGINNQVLQGAFFNASAEYMSRMAGSVHSDVVELLQKKLPRNSKTVLPGGLSFDTRNVTGNKNFHAKNNHLSASATNLASGPIPGMTSNLEIDYSSPNDQFERAALDPNNLPNIISSMASSSLFSSQSPMAELDRELATNLANAVKVHSNTTKTVVKAPEDPKILQFPFTGCKSDLLRVNKSELEHAALGLKELSGDKLGVDIGGDIALAMEVDTVDLLDDDTDDIKQPPRGSNRDHIIVIKQSDLDTLKPETLINDAIIDFWMKWMCRNQPNGPSSNTHTFTSHFMTELRNNGVESVRSWTQNKRINVFKKRLILIPVNADLHWSLCAIVNPGMIIRNYSKNRDRDEEIAFFLYFDSCKLHVKEIYCGSIRIWLNAEWTRLGLDKEHGISEPFSRKMKIVAPTVPLQTGGTDCGAFVCRYAYNMFVMRNQILLPNNIKSTITDGPAFQFGMPDMARIRKELKTLILNLSPIYFQFKSEEAEGLSTSSDIQGIWGRGDEEPKSPAKNNEPNSDEEYEDELDKIIAEGIYATMADHGGKQPTVSVKMENNPPAESNLLLHSATAAKHSAANHSTTKHSTKKHSPKKHRPIKVKRTTTKHSPPRKKFDIFRNYNEPTPKKKRGGDQKMLDRTIARNMENMYLTVPKKKRSKEQNKQRAKAKQVETGMRMHLAKPEDFAKIIAGAVGLPMSQTSQYERGEVRDRRGNHFCSQDALEVVENYLSCDEEEEEVEEVEEEEDSK